MQSDQLTLPDWRGTPLLEWQIHVDILESSRLVDEHKSAVVLVVDFDLSFSVTVDFVVLVISGKIDLLPLWQRERDLNRRLRRIIVIASGMTLRYPVISVLCIVPSLGGRQEKPNGG